MTYHYFNEKGSLTVANALYKATGKRFYHQPFAKELEKDIERG